MAKAAAIRTKAPVRRTRSSAKLAADCTTSREDIARRAFELYLARGASEGDSLSDWYRAEQELTAMR
jgi:hypothetical protein